MRDWGVRWRAMYGRLVKSAPDGDAEALDSDGGVEEDGCAGEGHLRDGEEGGAPVGGLGGAEGEEIEAEGGD